MSEEKKFYVVEPTGEIKELNEELLKKYKELEPIYKDELGLPPGGKGEPAHVELIRKWKIARPEPIADAGCLSYWPWGAFLMEMLRRLAWEELIEKLGAYPIVTPTVIDEEHPAVKWLIEHFPERHYKVLPGKEEKEKKLFLKTAGDYGSFSLLRDTRPSYKHTPVPYAEIWETDFRYEQRGELRGLHRLREFHMVNIHTFIDSAEKAWEFFWKVFNALLTALKRFKLEMDAFAIYAEEEYARKYEEDIKNFAKKWGKPILLVLVPKGKLYMSIWIDGIVFDSVGHPMEVVTAQFDPRSSENWEMYYYDEKSKPQKGFIVHAGFGVDRAIAALLEKIAKSGKRVFPIEISPVQVRIIPVSEKYLDKAKEIAELFEKEGIRYEIDDRNKRVEKKIADFEKSPIPYAIVVGKEEIEKGTVKVRENDTGKIFEVKLEEFIKEIKERIKDYPVMRGFGPRYLSKIPPNIEPGLV